jgi:hypothetical protein
MPPTFLTSALEAGELSTSRPGLFSPGVRVPGKGKGKDIPVTGHGGP